MRPGITFIGGGSFHWMPNLLRDCCLTPELAGFRIVLHDLAPDRLRAMERLGKKMLGEFGADLTVTSTLNREKALEGARFVVIAIATGGLKAMQRDLDISADFGVRHPVGDSAGPAGISRALRMIPVFFEIGRDVARRCPKAWVFNVSNPMSVTTRALSLNPGVKAAGLCHGLREGGDFICRFLEIEPAERMRMDPAGLNHFAWAVHMTIDGKDGWPAFRAALKRKGAKGKVSAINSAGLGSFRLDSDLFLKHGVFPLNPDRHTAEFLEDVIGPGSGYGRRFGLKFTTIADRRERFALRKKRALRWLKEPVPRERSGEELTRIMAAIVSGRPFEGVLNLPNRGQLADAARGAVVESFGIADHLGLRPYVSPALPPYVRELVLAHVESQEISVRAALDGDLSLVRRAFALDPLCRRLVKLNDLVDRLLRANREFLPRFKGS